MKTSIVKKVAALDKVVMICSAHGANYNPSNAALQPTALAALLQLAQEKSKAVIVAHTSYVMAKVARADGFEGIPTLASKIARMVAASSAPKNVKEEVKRLKARLHAKRKTASQVPAQSEGTVPMPPTENRSISRRDRDSMLDTLIKLVDLVASIPAYKPNEPDFTVEGLKARIVDLQALNLAAAQAKLELSNARIAMSKVMEGEGGVLESTRFAKDYIRAKFGMISKESQQVSKPNNF